MKFLTWLYIVQLPQLAFSTCYNPNGSVNTASFVCGNSTGVSVCCPTGFTCQSDGACQSPQLAGASYGSSYAGYGSAMFAPNMYNRGLCTDQSWNSTACPKYCMITLDGPNNMGRCPNATDDRYYCSTGQMPQDIMGCFSGTNVVILGSSNSSATPTTVGGAPSTSATKAATTSAVGSVGGNSTSSDSPSTSASPVSSGTIAAISLSVVIAVVMLIFGGIKLWRRRVRQYQHQHQASDESRATDSPISEYSIETKHELPTQTKQMAELDHKPDVKHELAPQSMAPHVRHELE